MAPDRTTSSERFAAWTLLSLGAPSDDFHIEKARFYPTAQLLHLHQPSTPRIPLHPPFIATLHLALSRIGTWLLTHPSQIHLRITPKTSSCEYHQTPETSSKQAPQCFTGVLLTLNTPSDDTSLPKWRCSKQWSRAFSQATPSCCTTSITQSKSAS